MPLYISISVQSGKVLPFRLVSDAAFFTFEMAGASAKAKAARRAIPTLAARRKAQANYKKFKDKNKKIKKKMAMKVVVAGKKVKKERGLDEVESVTKVGAKTVKITNKNGVVTWKQRRAFNKAAIVLRASTV